MSREDSGRDFGGRTRRILGRRVRERPIPVDVREEGAEYVLRSSLPGYARGDIHVTAKGSRIAISVDAAADGPAGSFRSRGGRTRRERVVKLAERIDERHVSAEYIDGELTIRAPKWRRPRRSRSVAALRNRVAGAGGVAGGTRVMTDGGAANDGADEEVVSEEAASDEVAEPGTNLVLFDPSGTDLLDEWLPDDRSPSERDEEIRSYEARIDEEIGRQLEYKTDKSGNAYRSR